MSCSELLSPGVPFLDLLSSPNTDGGFVDQSSTLLTDAQLENLLHVLHEQAQQQQGLQLHHELLTPKQQVSSLSAPLPLASNISPVCPVEQNLSDAEYAIDAEICQLLALKQQARQKQHSHSQNMALQQLVARLQAAGPTSNLLHDVQNALQMQDVASQMAMQSTTASEQCWGTTAAFSPDALMTSAAPTATVTHPGSGGRLSIDIGSFYRQDLAASPFAAGTVGMSSSLQQCSMALAAAADAMSMPFGSAITSDHYASAAAPVQVDLGLDLAAILGSLTLQDASLLLSPPPSYGSSCMMPPAGLSSFGGALSPTQNLMQGLQGTCSSSSALLMPAAASSFDFAPAGPPAGTQAFYNQHNRDVLQRSSCSGVLNPANGPARGLYSPEGRMQAIERARGRRHSMHLPSSHMPSAQHAGGAGVSLSNLGPAAWMQEGQACNREQQGASVGPACRPFGTALSPAGPKTRRHSVHLAGVGCMPAPHSSGMSAQSSMPAQWRAAGTAHAGMQVSTANNRTCRTSLNLPAAVNTASTAAATASGVFQASTRQPGGLSRLSMDGRPTGADRSGRQYQNVTGRSAGRCSLDLPAKSAAPKWADANWHPKAAAAAAASGGAAGNGSQHTKGTGVFMPRMAA